MFRKKTDETLDYSPGSNVFPVFDLDIPMPQGVAISRKRGDTLIGTLRETYGDDFAPGERSDMRLDTLLEKEGVTSINEFLAKQRV